MSDINNKLNDELANLDRVMRAYDRNYDTPTITVMANKSFSKDEYRISWSVSCYDVKVESKACTLEEAVSKFIAMLGVQLGTPMEVTHRVALPAPEQEHSVIDADIEEDGVPF